MREIWIFLFAFGTVLFGWPIISMFGDSIALYFFSAWITFILLISVATTYKGDGDNGG